MKPPSTKKTRESGYALYIAIVVITAVIIIATPAIEFFIKEFRLTGTVEEKSRAFYASDSGIECVYYQDRIQNNFEYPDISTLTCPASVPNFDCFGSSINPIESSIDTVNHPIDGYDEHTCQYTIENLQVSSQHPYLPTSTGIACVDAVVSKKRADFAPFGGAFGVEDSQWTVIESKGSYECSGGPGTGANQNILELSYGYDLSNANISERTNLCEGVDIMLAVDKSSAASASGADIKQSLITIVDSLIDEPVATKSEIITLQGDQDDCYLLPGFPCNTCPVSSDLRSQHVCL